MQVKNENGVALELYDLGFSISRSLDKEVMGANPSSLLFYRVKSINDLPMVHDARFAAENDPRAELYDEDLHVSGYYNIMTNPPLFSDDLYCNIVELRALEKMAPKNEVEFKSFPVAVREALLSLDVQCSPAVFSLIEKFCLPISYSPSEFESARGEWHYLYLLEESKDGSGNISEHNISDHEQLDVLGNFTSFIN